MALPAVLSVSFPASGTSESEDRATVARLDQEYQAAVERNDVATMDRILADDFVLVTGTGKTCSKTDLLEEARSRRCEYERQDDVDQVVRLYGDTAVVSARLRAKGTERGQPFDYEVLFSDVYLHTPRGWRYAFAQSSTRQPTASP